MTTPLAAASLAASGPLAAAVPVLDLFWAVEPVRNEEGGKE